MLQEGRGRCGMLGELGPHSEQSCQATRVATGGGMLWEGLPFEAGTRCKLGSHSERSCQAARVVIGVGLPVGAELSGNSCAGLSWAPIRSGVARQLTYWFELGSHLEQSCQATRVAGAAVDAVCM